MGTEDSPRRHEGPWGPNQEEMLCDRCPKVVKRGEGGWRAYWNPYGLWGWTFLCEQCADTTDNR